MTPFSVALITSLFSVIIFLLADIREKVKGVNEDLKQHIQDHIERKFCHPHVEIVYPNDGSNPFDRFLAKK